MGITCIERNLSELPSDHTLRMDVSFFIGSEKVNRFMKESGLDFFPLRKATVRIWNGSDISESDYSYLPTQYVYLTVNNISESGLDFEDMLYLTETAGRELETHRLEKGDVIITRSGTVGVSHLFDHDDVNSIFIPSGYLTMLRVDEGKIDKTFLVNYLNSIAMRDFFAAYSCGKDTQNVSQQSIKKIPFPSISREEQSRIVGKVRVEDEKIAKYKDNIPDMQEVIDEVFTSRLGYEPLENSINKDETRFVESIGEVGKRRHFRTGARYNSFWKYHQGVLFKTSKDYEIKRLRELIRVYPAKRLEKGFLDKQYILIDKEDVEQKTGIIKDEEWVDKIDSDKKVFGDCDILVSKIRPYLGQVFINDKSKSYIGTPEFVPYKVKGDECLAQFIRYVLLSKHFLHFSGKVMSGKLQPRLTPDEMLDMGIPMPPLSEVKAAVDEISKRLGDTKKMSATLHDMTKKRDALFVDLIAELGS